MCSSQLSAGYCHFGSSVCPRYKWIDVGFSQRAVFLQQQQQQQKERARLQCFPETTQREMLYAIRVDSVPS